MQVDQRNAEKINFEGFIQVKMYESLMVLIRRLKDVVESSKCKFMYAENY